MSYVDLQKRIVVGAQGPQNYVDGANSFAEFILKRLRANPDFVSLVDGVEDKQLTSIELLHGAIRVAKCLRNLGVTDADKVALCTENRLEGAFAIFGVLLTGAVLVPMNPLYTDRELNHAVQLARPKIIFASSQSFEKLNQVSRQHDFIETIIMVSDAFPKASFKRLVTYSQLMAMDSNWSDFECVAQNMAEKVTVILYSSGTTGMAKGVQLTEQNILIAIAQQHLIVDPDADKLLTNPIVLTIAPWSHAFGCMGLLGLVLTYQRIVFLAKFVDRQFLSAIQRFKVNSAHLVPPLMVFIAKSPIVSEYDLSSLVMIGCGAAPLSKETQEAVCKRINVPYIRQGYGMTESTLGVTSQNERCCTQGSIGELKPGNIGRVMDTETGQLLGPNEKGELQFRGGTIMKGYIDDRAATSATVDADGWLHTGDIGYYDERGEWFIVDRLKELIKNNGFQVPPAEIEGLLLQHPSIADAAVVGVPDEQCGELPLAFVVKQPDAKSQSLTENEVKQFVAERASRPKHLHGGVRFLAAIPKNPSGKILRRELRDMLKNVPSKL